MVDRHVVVQAAKLLWVFVVALLAINAFDMALADVAAGTVRTGTLMVLLALAVAVVGGWWLGRFAREEE